MTDTLRTLERDLGRRATFQVDRRDELQDLGPLIDRQAHLLSLVDVLALVLGGTGLLSSGLASVRQRRRAFGIERALGATTTGLFLAVLLESLIASAMATVLSLGLSLVILSYLPGAVTFAGVPLGPASLPWHAAFVGMAASGATGLAAGVLPAIAAASVPVIRAMRD